MGIWRRKMANARKRQMRSSVGNRRKRAADQFRKSSGAMGESVFHFRLHFTEGQSMSFRDENRIIAKTFAAAGWKDQRAIDPALEQFGCRFRCRQGKRADKESPLVGHFLFSQLLLHPTHRNSKVFCRTCPARRIN